MGILKLLGLGAGFNPLYLAITAAVIFTAGAASGGYSAWTASGWKHGAEIERLKGSNRLLEDRSAILTDATVVCMGHITQVREALDAFHKAQKDIADSVKAAMAQADGQADGLIRRAEETMRRAMVPPDQWCATIQREQDEYLALRRTDRLEKR